LSSPCLVVGICKLSKEGAEARAFDGSFSGTRFIVVGGTWGNGDLEGCLVCESWIDRGRSACLNRWFWVGCWCGLFVVLG